MKSKRIDGPSLYLVLGHELAAVSGGHVDPATGQEDNCGDTAPKAETRTETKPEVGTEKPVVPAAPAVTAERPILRCGTVVPAGYLYRVH
jgi:hypothetical protein